MSKRDLYDFMEFPGFSFYFLFVYLLMRETKIATESTSEGSELEQK